MEAVAQVIEIAPPQHPETAEAVAEVAEVVADTTTEAAAAAEAKKPKAVVLDSLDSVLRAINEQDEQLKAMKTQIQDMLTTNTALKRGIKQIVTDASKTNELETELQSARKKLSMLKSFLNG